MATDTYLYDLLPGRKFRERGRKKYVGPCVVESDHPNLVDLFPGSFKRHTSKDDPDGKKEAEKEFNRARSPRKKKPEPVEFARPEDYNEPKLKPVHKGGGKYNVFEEETGRQINTELLTKKDAYQICGKSL